LALWSANVRVARAARVRPDMLDAPNPAAPVWVWVLRTSILSRTSVLRLDAVTMPELIADQSLGAVQPIFLSYCIGNRNGNS